MMPEHRSPLKLSSGVIYMVREDGAFDTVAQVSNADFTMPPSEACEAKAIPVNPYETMTVKLQIPLNQQRRLKRFLDEQRRYFEEVRLLRKHLHIMLHAKSHRIRNKALKRILAMPIAREALMKFLSARRISHV